MEEKLREYRALRRRKELIENTKTTLHNTKEKVVKFLTPKFFTNMGKEKQEEEVLLLEEETPSQDIIDYKEPHISESEAMETESIEEPDEPESWPYFITKLTIYVIIWSTLWLFFLKQGFGAVYFAISLLVIIYLNTSDRKKKPGEVSAYSVFNKNCESIDGTLKAEDLQRQMLYGVVGIRVG